MEPVQLASAPVILPVELAPVSVALPVMPDELAFVPTGTFRGDCRARQCQWGCSSSKSSLYVPKVLGLPMEPVEHARVAELLILPAEHATGPVELLVEPDGLSPVPVLMMEPVEPASLGFVGRLQWRLTSLRSSQW